MVSFSEGTVYGVIHGRFRVRFMIPIGTVLRAHQMLGAMPTDFRLQDF